MRKAEREVISYADLALQKARVLERQFPGNVVLLPEGFTLYHSSRNPNQLYMDNTFNLQLSTFQDGIFFSDQAANHANIKVQLKVPLIFANTNSLADHTFKSTLLKLSERSNGCIQGLKTIGFDGTFEDTLSPDVPKGAHEIVVFPNALHSLNGNIQKFNLHERTINSQVSAVLSHR